MAQKKSNVDIIIKISSICYQDNIVTITLLLPSVSNWSCKKQRNGLSVMDKPL